MPSEEVTTGRADPTHEPLLSCTAEMTPVNEISGTRDSSARSELFAALHPDDAIETIGEDNVSGTEESLQPAEELPEDVNPVWAWVVVFATLVVKALTMAFPSCVGLFYTDLQKEFNASNSEVSWIPAIIRGLRHAAGPFCSLLMERLGSRTTVMLGGVLSGLGLAAASLTQSIGQLYITAGVLTGLGFCFSLQPSVAIIGHYFVRRRAFANAISSMGMGLGMLCLPHLVTYLRIEFGWRGSCLILGSVVLNICVCGAVMRPTGARGAPLLKRQTEEASDTPGRLPMWRRVASSVSKRMAFDQMLQNSRYCVYVCGVTWLILGFGVPIFYLYPYAKALGMAPSKATDVLTCLAVVNVLTRPLFGLVYNKSWIKERHIGFFSCALLLNGLSNGLCCFGPSFPLLMVYAAIQGLSMSVVGSLMITILMNFVEMRRLSSALGLFNMMKSVPLFIGPPLAGVLVDVTGDYSYVFAVCGAVVASSGVFLMVAFHWLDSRASVASSPASSD
ncbi:monocarboxylate transporter 6-like [Pungitius pungitius]|uniref:monocarboxylate transporter 6-like n=1 Tax=Pungitius pungitius TaxID=134920 RepID=UPI002E13314D